MLNIKKQCPAVDRPHFLFWEPCIQLIGPFTDWQSVTCANVCVLALHSLCVLDISSPSEAGNVLTLSVLPADTFPGWTEKSFSECHVGPFIDVFLPMLLNPAQEVLPMVCITKWLAFRSSSVPNFKSMFLVHFVSIWSFVQGERFGWHSLFFKCVYNSASTICWMGCLFLLLFKKASCPQPCPLFLGPRFCPVGLQDCFGCH